MQKIQYKMYSSLSCLESRYEIIQFAYFMDSNPYGRSHGDKGKLL